MTPTLHIPSAVRQLELAVEDMRAARGDVSLTLPTLRERARLAAQEDSLLRREAAPVASSSFTR